MKLVKDNVINNLIQKINNTIFTDRKNSINHKDIHIKNGVIDNYPYFESNGSNTTSTYSGRSIKLGRTTDINSSSPKANLRLFNTPSGGGGNV